MRQIALAALALAVTTPTFAAEFYVVQDSTTRKCTITESRPTVTTHKIVGPDGTVYTTREQAMTGMKQTKVCVED
jgi:hypothetical protein